MTPAFAAVLVVLVTLAFVGLAWSTTQTMLTTGPEDASPQAASDVTLLTAPHAVPSPARLTKGEVSPWIVLAMALGIAALVILGVHLPADLSRLLDHAAHELRAP